MDASPASAQNRPPGHRSLVAEGLGGILVAFLTASYTVSYALVLFAAAPAGLQDRGIAMLVVASIALGLAGALFSTLPFSFISHEGTTIAAMAAAVAALTVHLQGKPEPIIAATLSMALALIAILAGVVAFALGQLHGGRIVRVVPLQVMAGFFSATGWSLLKGGVIAASKNAPPWGLPLWTAPGGAGARTLMALGFAALMAGVARRVRSPYVLPGAILAALLLHHGVAASLGVSAAQQRAAGWLIGPPRELEFALPWSPQMLANTDWPALLADSVPLAVVIAVSAVTILFNSNALELASRKDVDVDRDLRANGLAALCSGAIGGVLGVVNLSRSMMLLQFGVRRRLTTGVAAAASGGVFLVAPQMLGQVPVELLGGLLCYIGLDMLLTWAVQVRKRLTWSEWLTTLAMLAITVQFGLIAAVIAGMVAGCITFAVIYSRMSPVRARYNGGLTRSNVDRTAAERAVLEHSASATLVLYLQGFLFFGTAYRLLQDVKAEIARNPALRFLVLDGSNVDGQDGSALAALERLHQVAADHDVTVMLAAAPAALRSAATSMWAGQGLRILPSLDLALEECEAALLNENGGHRADTLQDTLAAEMREPARAETLIELLELRSIPAGSMFMVQGERSTDLLFIESGEADVIVQFDSGPPMRVRRLRAGAMLGEVGFTLGTPRTATVRAETPCRLRVLTPSGLERLEAEEPDVAFALSQLITKRLSRRLLDKDELIVALQRGVRR